MDLSSLLRRDPPEPWSYGGKIPWNDPEFSARMLKEHLSQEHDLASRRGAQIDAQVSWLRESVIPEGAAVLDLGCGPGFYTSRLARLGHRCMGIDFSPASIEHAEAEAAAGSLDCTYRLADVREADLDAGFGAVLLLYAEFNTFRRPEAEALLMKARRALAPGGRLVLEVHTEDQVRALGSAAPSWYVSPDGLFADEPHLCLTDCAWFEEEKVSAQRFTVFSQSCPRPETFVCSTQAYADEEFDALLKKAGFEHVRRVLSPADVESRRSSGLLMITADVGGTYEREG